MDYSLFQKLSESELDNYLSEIDLALEFHIKWLSALNRAIICQTDIDLQQAHSILTSEDHFNRWYSSVHDEDLLEMPAFKTLGKIHAGILNLGRELLTKAGQSEHIYTSEYDRFMTLSTELRHQIHVLKSKIKSNLKLVAKLMGKVFENAEEGVLITDVEARILNVNQAFVNVTQFSKEEVLGKKPSILHSGNHDLGFYERMWKVLLSEHRWQGEIWNRRKNGDIYPEWLSITAVLDDHADISHYIGIFSDVSAASEGDERLYHLAHYDSLCDLPNRLLFYDRLRQSMSRSKRNDSRVAVIYMDLDGFKEVNDEYGHSVGDELLQQVSKRVVDILRESDTVARIGGDEFTLIINDVESKDSLTTIADKILSTLQETYKLNGYEFNVSASIGISLFPENSEDINSLVKQADIAMYKAKKDGKNRYKFFDAGMS